MLSPIWLSFSFLSNYSLHNGQFFNLKFWQSADLLHYWCQYIHKKLNHFLFKFTLVNPDRNKTLFFWNQLTRILLAVLPSDTDAYLGKFRTLNLKFSCCTTFDKISSLFWNWHASAMSSLAILKPNIFVNSLFKKNQYPVLGTKLIQ